MTPSAADVVIVFDGGALGNPGAGYGSYVANGAISTPRPVRIEFPGTTTNNQAEYLTLIAGLRFIAETLEQSRRSPKDISIEIRSDSMLVVEQVNGRWKIRKAELLPRVNEARELLEMFGAWKLVWHPRSESVRILGH